MAADPRVSKGARMERTAFRNYIARRLRQLGGGQGSIEMSIAHDWIKDRQRRYNKAKGGLGR